MAKIENANETSPETLLPDTVFEYLNLTPEKRTRLFLDTITETSHPASYWINFPVARKNAAVHADTIDQLDELIDTTPRQFADRIAQNPDVLKLVPAMLGIRDDHYTPARSGKLRVFDSELAQNIVLDFKEIDTSNLDQYIRFIDASGLGDVLRNGEISNAAETLLAVEWTMSVSGRKNRSGDEGQANLEGILARLTRERPGYVWHGQTTYKNIKDWYDGIDLGEHFKNRTFDGSIYNGQGRVMVLETNIFNGGGGKIRTVCNDFVRDAEAIARAMTGVFVYLSDGKGWFSEVHNLERVQQSVITLNYAMVRKGYLDQLVNKL